jgi:hypothetical protein
MSTIITHKDAKSYCDSLRKKKKDGKAFVKYEDVIFDAFIDDTLDADGKCIRGLYEKVNYVRDRVIYRPSLVVASNGALFQTSKDVRKEIDSLPDSQWLYSVVKETIASIIALIPKEKGDTNLFWWILYVFYIPRNDRDCSELKDLGHSEDDIRRITKECDEARYYEDKGVLCVSHNISHLLELESIEIIIKWHKRYWVPLYPNIHKALFA